MQFDLFISYARRDARVLCRRRVVDAVAELKRALESHWITDISSGRKSRFRVCTDVDDFELVGTFDDVMRARISQSTAFLLICSPHAASSTHVRHELEVFKALPCRPMALAAVLGLAPASVAPEIFTENDVAADLLPPEGVTQKDYLQIIRRESHKIVAKARGLKLADVYNRFLADRRRARSRVALAALGAFAVSAMGIARLLADLDLKASRRLTALGEGAFSAGNFESAARYALAASIGSETAAIGYNALRAKHLLSAAMLNSRRRDILDGAMGAIDSISLSHSGKYIAAAGDAPAIKVWELSNRKVIFSHALSDPCADSDEDLIESVNEAPVLVRFAPQQEQVLGAYGASAFLWDLQSGRLIYHTCQYDAAAADGKTVTTIRSVGFSPTGDRFLTVGDDGTVREWSSDQHRETLQIRLEGEEINSADYSPDGSGIVSSTRSGYIVISSAKTGASVRIFRGFQNRAKDACYSPDQKYILARGEDSTARLGLETVVRIWEAKSGSQKQTLRHTGSVTEAKFSADSKYVLTASGYGDSTAHLWSIETGEVISRYVGHRGGAIVTAELSCDQSKVVTGGTDGTAREWDTLTGTLLDIFAGHRGAVNSAMFSADCSQIVTASDDQTIRVWQPANGTAWGTYENAGNQSASRAAISADHRRSVVFASPSHGQIIDTVTGRATEIELQSAGSARDPSFSPNGEFLAASASDGAGSIWLTKSGRLLKALPTGSSLRFPMVFSPDSARVARLADDHTIEISALLANDPPVRLGSRAVYPDKSLFLLGGTRLAACCDSEGKTYLYDTTTGKLMNSDAGLLVGPTGGTDRTTLLTFVVKSEKPVFRLVDAQGGRLIREVAFPDESLTEVPPATFLPSKGLVLIGRSDGTVTLLDLQSGKSLMNVKPFEDRVNDLDFLPPGGQRAIAVSNDGTAAVLDLQAGLLLTVLRGHSGPVTKVSVSADGQFAITQSSDSVITWRLPGEASANDPLRASVCRHLLLYQEKNGSAASVSHVTAEENAASPQDFLATVGAGGDVCAPAPTWRYFLRTLNVNFLRW